MIEPVEHFDDPRLDHYRNIPDPRLLAAHRLFMAEGRLVVSRLLASPFPVVSVLATRVAREALTDPLAARGDVPVYEVTQDTMNQVAGLNIHRGCLAVGRRVDMPPVDGLVRAPGILVALEGVGNADNVGSLFRNVAALGGTGIVLDRACADPLYRKALRTSMGAALAIPWARTDRWLDTLEGCRQAGRTLLALTPGLDAVPLDVVRREFASSELVLVLGHEGTGLSEATMTRCTRRVRIPMRPGMDSLNVATAAAIALYELGTPGSQT